MSNEQSEVLATLHAMDASTVHQIEGLRAPFVLVPKDYALKDLEHMLPEPYRIDGTVVAQTAQSLIDYAQRFGDSRTAIFAQTLERTITVALDYHEPGKPSRRTHKAIYKSKFSREWEAWQSINGKSMSQLEFAEFIEEHVADVVQPNGAALLETALKFQLIRQAVFGSAARLQSGEFQFNWSDENQKGTVEVPEQIVLGIPVFHGGIAYRVSARLRYRLTSGEGLKFTIKLNEPERTIEHAFECITNQVRAALENIPYFEAEI